MHRSPHAAQSKGSSRMKEVHLGDAIFSQCVHIFSLLCNKSWGHHTVWSERAQSNNKAALLRSGHDSALIPWNAAVTCGALSFYYLILTHNYQLYICKTKQLEISQWKLNSLIFIVGRLRGMKTKQPCVFFKDVILTHLHGLTCFKHIYYIWISHWALFTSVVSQRSVHCMRKYVAPG